MDKTNYQNGKIYKIWSPSIEEFYIGSTTQPLIKRLYKHKMNSQGQRNWNMKLYQSMRNTGKDNFRIELIENYPCDIKHELRKREGEIIRELKPTLNSRIECRSMKEYLEDNKDIMCAKYKQYYYEHRDKKLANMKTYRENNADKFKKYREEIQATRSEPFICDICGGKYTRVHKLEHERSKKHMKALDSKNE
jgi:hypothetical protein